LYQNYVNGGGFDQKFGLPKALEKIQQKVETKGKQLNTYGNKVQGLTSTYSTLNNKLTEQSKINFSESDRYLSELDKTNSIMQNMDNGMDNILNETDIMVLQKNYSYLFWSIIAIGTVIVSMNIVKKN
jgi:CII-binding regulator of phage lambda lysogenization HflD